jgi:hypothetical protein
MKLHLQNASHVPVVLRHRPVRAPWPLAYWRGAQYLLLLAGMLLIALLNYYPAVGLAIMWNILIPLVPALVVLAPGVWRNLCPMATVSLLPRHLGFSRRKVLPPQWAGVLTLTSLGALFIIVPLRHPLLNTNAELTVLVLLLSASLAFIMGVVFEWRSGWCNSLCPIHQVEKLYGSSPLTSFRNARCDVCSNCTTPCPDSTRSMNPTISYPVRSGKISGHLLVGSLVGFIWGWFRLPDFSGGAGVHEIADAYIWCWGCALISLLVYAAAYRWICRSSADFRLLVRLFATAAITTYYWYRIPALTGFGLHPGSGMIVDLTAVFPQLPLIFHILSSSFFVWFLLLRKHAATSWTLRPATVMDIKSSNGNYNK